MPRHNYFRRNFPGSEGTMEISQPRSGWSLAQNIFQVLKGRWTFSAVLSGRNFLRTVFQPLRNWLISGDRSATQFALAAMILFFAVGATAQTNSLSDAEIQGRQLAQKILEQSPATNFIQNGVFKIRDNKGNMTNIYVWLETFVLPESWQTLYLAGHASGSITFPILRIIHETCRTNQYSLEKSDLSRNSMPVLGPSTLSGNQTMIPFANSDFWLCDLGLEFFHWPEQKILPKMTNLKRGRDYTLLESTNPNPSTNGYSRVLSWIDKETGGILEAEAYDFNGKLLKEFAPKSFKKINGQWELQEMEIRNVQTGSRTRLEFDLKK